MRAVRTHLINFTSLYQVIEFCIDIRYLNVTLYANIVVQFLLNFVVRYCFRYYLTLKYSFVKKLLSTLKVLLTGPSLTSHCIIEYLTGDKLELRNGKVYLICVYSCFYSKSDTLSETNLSTFKTSLS